MIEFDHHAPGHARQELGDGRWAGRQLPGGLYRAVQRVRDDLRAPSGHRHCWRTRS